MAQLSLLCLRRIWPTASTDQSMHKCFMTKLNSHLSSKNTNTNNYYKRHSSLDSVKRGSKTGMMGYERRRDGGGYLHVLHAHGRWWVAMCMGLHARGKNDRNERRAGWRVMIWVWWCGSRGVEGGKIDGFTRLRRNRWINMGMKWATGSGWKDDECNGKTTCMMDEGMGLATVEWMMKDHQTPTTVQPKFIWCFTSRLSCPRKSP